MITSKLNALSFLMGILFMTSCTGNSGNTNEFFHPGVSDYLIPVNTSGAHIGKISESGLSQPVQFQIINDSSGLFETDSTGIIRLKPGASIDTLGNTYIYGITIGMNGYKKEIELVRNDFLTNKAVAHRGAWKNTGKSQNSIGSLQKAIDAGCAWSELDVWMSADGHPILSHDAEIDGLKVEESTLNDLKKVHLNDGEYLPSLEECIELVKKQNKTRLFVEIKPSNISPERAQQLAVKVVELVHAKKAQAWVKYISFDINVLLRILEKDHFASVAYLGNDKSVEELHDLNIWGIDFNRTMFENNGKLVNEAHELGMTVNAWTVNDPELMDYLLMLGVDFITTDEPEILLSKTALPAQR